jgi:ribosome maturation factor RimP
MQTVQQQKLEVLLAPVIAGMGFEYVGCDYVPQRSRSVLRIYVDKEQGITLDECAKISRQVGAVLDVEGTISEPHYLEVSSPGLERPLFTLEQCRRFVGKQLLLRFHTLFQGKRKLIGILIAVGDKGVTVKTEEGEDLDIPLTSISKANLVFELVKPMKKHKEGK